MASQKLEDNPLQLSSQLTPGRAPGQGDHAAAGHESEFVAGDHLPKAKYHLQTHMSGQITPDSLVAEEFTKKVVADTTAELKTELSSLQWKFEAKFDEANKSTKGMVTSLETRICKLQAQNTKLQGTLRATQEKVTTLNNRHCRYEDEIIKNMKRALKQNFRILCLTLLLVIGVWTAMAEIRLTNKLKGEEIGAVMDRIEIDIHELDVDLEKLTIRIESELSQTQQSIKGLEEKLTSRIESDYELSKNSIKKLEVHIKKLTTRIEFELSKTQQSIKELEEKLTSRIKSIKELEVDIEKLTTRIESELFRTRQSIKELDEAHLEKFTTRIEFESTQQSIKELEVHIEKLTTRIESELSKTQQSIQELEVHIEKQTQQLTEFASEKSFFRRSIEYVGGYAIERVVGFGGSFVISKTFDAVNYIRKWLDDVNDR